LTRPVGAGANVSIVLSDHDFKVTCGCDSWRVCPAPSLAVARCLPQTYAIETNSGVLCVGFAAALPAAADAADSNNLAPLAGNQLEVSIDGVRVAYSAGAVATSNNGQQLRALVLMNTNRTAVVFSACGPFIVQNSSRSSPDVTKSTLSTGSLVPLVVGGIPTAPTFPPTPATTSDATDSASPKPTNAPTTASVVPSSSPDTPIAATTVAVVDVDATTGGATTLCVSAVALLASFVWHLLLKLIFFGTQLSNLRSATAQAY
jgi:hypothetical protein